MKKLILFPLFISLISLAAGSLESSAHAEHHDSDYHHEHDSDRYEDNHNESRDEERDRNDYNHYNDRSSFDSSNTQPKIKCPPGTKPDNHRCTDDERKRGCKDYGAGNGQGCSNF